MVVRESPSCTSCTWEIPLSIQVPTYCLVIVLCVCQLRVWILKAISARFKLLCSPIRYSMGDAMNELAPGNKITMKLSEDGSGRGAAIVAAVACRLVQKD